MVVHPLLLFPRPDLVKRQTLNPPIIHIHKPSVVRQTERLSPKFQQLQRAINARRVSIRSTTTGIEPEMVLVIEVIGDIVKFSNAVKRIPGLEWMGELKIIQFHQMMIFIMKLIGIKHLMVGFI
jgi:hypothetical protein